MEFTKLLFLKKSFLINSGIIQNSLFRRFQAKLQIIQGVAEPVHEWIVVLQTMS
jgi:hypothetical protein